MKATRVSPIYDRWRGVVLREEAAAEEASSKGATLYGDRPGTGTGTGTRTGRKGSLLSRKLPNSDQLILSLLDRLRSEHELSCIEFISNR